VEAGQAVSKWEKPFVLSSKICYNLPSLEEIQVIGRRKEEGGTVIRIEQGRLPSLSIEISSEGVKIRPLEKPSLLRLTKERTIDKKISEFRLAYINAAAALLDHNLPEATERPLPVEDRVDVLRQATQSLLAARQGGKKRLKIQVELTQKDFSQLIENRSITAPEWAHCQGLLTQEIKGSVRDFQEERFQRKATKAKT